VTIEEGIERISDIIYTEVIVYCAPKYIPIIHQIIHTPSFIETGCCFFKNSIFFGLSDIVYAMNTPKNKRVIIPSQRVKLPSIIKYTKSAVEKKKNGRSTSINDLSTFNCRTTKPATQPIKSIFATFEPIILSTANDVFPSSVAIIDVIISGIDPQIATIVAPIINEERPKYFPIFSAP
jgi:hypothetical protein